MKELETKLQTIDKSSIFRTLTLFSNQHVVHQMEDGNDIVRYELCMSNDDETDSDMHAHFLLRAVSTHHLSARSRYSQSQSAHRLQTFQCKLYAERSMPRMCSKAETIRKKKVKKKAKAIQQLCFCCIFALCNL